jgi:hypothetical protein
VSQSGQWRIAGQNLSNSWNQPAEHSISPANVNGLTPKWVFTTGGDVSATPTVDGDAVYFPDWGGNLFAVEKNSGRLIWPHKISDYDGAQLRFEPPTLSLKAGQIATVGVVVDNVNDLFSIPFLLQNNPAVISVEEVRHGGFLQAGDQEITIVQKVDNEHGQAIISATRQANTAGASGTGTIMGIMIKALATGTSTLSIVQLNAKDSQQRPFQLMSGEASVQVKP